MSLAVLAPLTPDQRRSAMSGRNHIERPQFLYHANHLLNQGIPLKQVANTLQVTHNEIFQTSLARVVKDSDVLNAREILIERVPCPAFRFEKSRWVLTLSRQFRRVIGEITKENPQYNHRELDAINDHFKPYMSNLTFNTGYGFVGPITMAEVRTSFALYPEGMAGTPPQKFETSEAVIFEWCRTVPYQENDRSLIGYAEHFGDAELLYGMLHRCLKACEPPLPSFMSQEQKDHYAQLGTQCFWRTVEYVNWLCHHNPLDAH